MRDRKEPIGRRAVLAGAGTAGAVAAAAALLPSVEPQAPAGPKPAAAPGSDGSSGYQLTEHVKRYYGTARI